MYHFQPYVSARNDAVTTAAAAAALCGYSASAHHHHHHLAAAAAASAMPMQNFLLPNALASLSLGGSHNNHMIGGGLASANATPAVAVAKTTTKDPNMKVTLENRDLWSKFHDNTCEMIITRAGRRMFPTIKISITGLDPDEHYRVVMDIVPVDDCRYKYHNSEWVASGKADPHPAGKYFEHQDAPGKGVQFMRQTLSFHKLKLTNNNFDQHGHIILNSMHKYQPRIHIIRDSDMPFLQMSVINTFTFPETIFIAVTAYQNEQITQLKIDNNPFAKGFRDLKTSRRNQEFYELVHYTQQREAPYNNNNGHQQQSSSSATTASTVQLSDQQLIGVDNNGDSGIAAVTPSCNRKRHIDAVAAESNKNSTGKQEHEKHQRRSTETSKATGNFVNHVSPKLPKMNLNVAPARSNATYDHQPFDTAGQQPHQSSPQRVQEEQFAYQQQQHQFNYLHQTERFSNRNQQHDALVAAQQQQQQHSSYYTYQQRSAAAMQSFMQSSADHSSNAFGFAAAAAAAAHQQPNNGVYNHHHHFGPPPSQQHQSSTVHHHQNNQQSWTASPYTNASAAAAAAAQLAAAAAVVNYPASAASYSNLQFVYAQQAAAAALQSAGAAGHTWANGGSEGMNTTPTQLDIRTTAANFQSPPPRQQQLNYGTQVNPSFSASAAAFGGLGTSPTTNGLLNSCHTSCELNVSQQQQQHQVICGTATTTASLFTAAVAAAATVAPPLTMMVNQLRPTRAANNNNVMPSASYGLAAEFAARAMQSQHLV